MLIAADVRAYICREPVDMRKSIDGLSHLVEPLLAQNPVSDEEERATGWYGYLEESLAFPFEGRIRKAMVSSPLRQGQTVAVTGW